MERNKTITIIIIIAAVLLVGGIIFRSNVVPPEKENLSASLIISQEFSSLPRKVGVATGLKKAGWGSVVSLAEKAALVVNDGSQVSQIFELEVGEQTTAFELLQKSGLEISYKEYEDMGVFVEAIGDKVNGDDGKYWLYYVNGEMPQVAVDKQAVNPGDKVEFRFEESPF